MSSSPAYTTKIYSHGSRVVVTGEATTELTPTTYQITDVARRLIDPETVVTVGGSVVTAVDYFEGIITLAADPGGAVTVDYAYLGVAAIGGSNAYSIELAGDILDDTDFQNAGYRTRTQGLLDVTVTIDRYDDLNNKFRMHKAAAERVYIEIQAGAGTLIFKGWYVIETTAGAGDLGALETEALSFNLASLPGITPFAFSIIES